MTVNSWIVNLNFKHWAKMFYVRSTMKYLSSFVRYPPLELQLTYLYCYDAPQRTWNFVLYIYILVLIYLWSTWQWRSTVRKPCVIVNCCAVHCCLLWISIISWILRYRLPIYCFKICTLFLNNSKITNCVLKIKLKK